MDKDELDNISKVFNEAVDAMQKDEEEYWNSLSSDEQLKAFCAVVRRIHKGEIEDKGTYRYVLYDVFKFGPESYMPAQMAGYLSIHNSIYDADHDSKMLEAFCKKNNIEDYENKIRDFIL